MVILGEYRKHRKTTSLGHRRIVLLAVLLGLVVAMMALFHRKAAEVHTAPSIRPRPAVHESPAAPQSPPAERLASAWHALPPEKERALLARIIDQAPLAVREHREAYHYLLNKLHHMTDAQVAAEADPTISYADYVGQPEIVRGSMVEVAGRLLRLEKTGLDQDKAGLTAVYEGQIMDAKGHLYSFCLTKPPSAPFSPGTVRFEDGLRVRLQGVFMQIIVYRDRHIPPRNVATPLIIGRRLIEMQPAQTASDTISWLWVALLALATLGAGLWLFLAARRPPPARTR